MVTSIPNNLLDKNMKNWYTFPGNIVMTIYIKISLTQKVKLFDNKEE